MTADQDKGRQEEKVTDGFIGEDRLNQNTTSSDMSKQSNQDYEELKKRGLATVGGGNIPGGGTISNSTVDSFSGENVEKKSVKDSSEGSEPAATNTIDKSAQSSSGGRHPSQPQTAMGDQDATQGRSGDEVTEPMSSRAPDKINQKQK